ncbi:MAG: hydrogenase nickel incorporation protein HypB [Phycisphaerae bacterium]|jgi:hydrogenase nickel incorporation protein HypB
MNIPVVRKLLEKNAAAAQENRAWFDRRSITCVNLLGGPGSGKTTLLEHVLPRLAADARCAVLEGDLATTRDAERIAAIGVPAVQLVTDGGCHLTAEHVQRALRELDAQPADLVFIENVGNLVCPANFELGEHARVVALSVAEGDDKPAKYALMFRRAQLVVLTKLDLLPLVRFDVKRVRDDLRRIQPDIDVLETNLRLPQSFDAVTHWLRRMHANRAPGAKSGSGAHLG